MMYQNSCYWTQVSSSLDPEQVLCVCGSHSEHEFLEDQDGGQHSWGWKGVEGRNIQPQNQNHHPADQKSLPGVTSKTD